MNAVTETHSLAGNEQRQISIHGSRNVFLFRFFCAPRLASGGHSWGFLCLSGLSFLELRGNDIFLAYFGEKESVSDLFQITLV